MTSLRSGRKDFYGILSNYCGLGGNGIPTHAVDQLCKVHDQAYEELRQRGYNPYLAFNRADEVFLDELKKIIPQSLRESIVKKGAEFFFNVKERIASRIDETGSFTDLPDMGKKKLRGVHGSWGVQVSDEERDFGKRKEPVKTMEVSADGETHATDTESMDVEEDIPESAMDDTITANAGDGLVLRSGAQQAGNGTNGTGETPVDMSIPRHLLYSEVVTADLPFTCWFSMNRLDRTSPVVLKIRLNCPYNIFTGNTLVKQTDAAQRQKGLSNDIAPADSNTRTTRQYFPNTVVGSTVSTGTETSFGTIPAANALPAKLTYYNRLYESYHTISTFYRVTFQNAANENSREVEIFEEEDGYTSSSTGNVIPTDQRYFLYQNWPRVKSHFIGGRNQNDTNLSRKVIEGVWRPNSIQMNTVNNEDIKAWWAVGAEPATTWVEQKVFLAFAGSMADQSSTASDARGVNVRVDLVYKVQFRDLQRYLRYPQSSDSTTNVMILPTDMLQTPNNKEA